MLLSYTKIICYHSFVTQKMVKLTSSLSKYVPFWYSLSASPSKRYFKKHNLFRMTLNLYGRSRNCYRLAINKWTKKVQTENEAKKKNKIAFRDLFSQRIYGACKDLGFEYHIFISMLPMVLSFYFLYLYFILNFTFLAKHWIESEDTRRFSNLGTANI